MKLASYNVENLFMRARALNGSGFSAEGPSTVPDFPPKAG
jgi:hypothetical protein